MSEQPQEKEGDAICPTLTASPESNAAPTVQPAGAASEWTEGKVFAYFESEDFKGLAKVINAALAVHRQAVFDCMSLSNDMCEKLEKELAAERKKYQGALHHMEACRALLGVSDDEVLYQSIKLLVDALETILVHHESTVEIKDIAADALAKVKK
jgi:hypothetical protein